MSKSELTLWKKYTELVKKHNAKYEKMLTDEKIKLLKEDRDSFQKMKEQEAKECNERFRLYNLLPWYIKIFTEAPYCTKYLYSTNPRISNEINNLIAHINVTEKVGGKKEVTYENFLTWQITKNL